VEAENGYGISPDQKKGDHFHHQCMTSYVVFTLDLYSLYRLQPRKTKMENKLHAVSRASQIEERYEEHEIPCLRLSKIGCKVILQLVLQPLFSIPNVDVPQKNIPDLLSALRAEIDHEKQIFCIPWFLRLNYSTTFLDQIVQTVETAFPDIFSFFHGSGDRQGICDWLQSLV
jgi:hypothetical protein